MNNMRLLNAAALMFLATCLAGLIWTPHPPEAQAFRDAALTGSQPGHWLGIDALGRDFLSRVWRGAGNSLSMALAALAGTSLLASAILLAEQTASRALGNLLRAAIGIWVAVPVFFIGLVLLVFLRPGPETLVLAAAIGNVPLAFRQLRVLWLEHRHASYVEASVVLGASRWLILRNTLWPNMRPDLFALGKLLFAIALLELSGLAFIGLIGNSDFPELGAILKQNQAFLHTQSSLVIWPGLALSTLLLLVHAMRLPSR